MPTVSAGRPSSRKPAKKKAKAPSTAAIAHKKFLARPKMRGRRLRR